MKTQIIQLEIHDDTISVRDKMDWSQTPRILLVWPARGNVLRNRLDLILLERYSSSHGSQLALLTKDPEVIFQAGEAGIPVFQSRKTAQLQPWRKSFREFKRRELAEKASVVHEFDPFSKIEEPNQTELPVWARIVFFIGGVLAVLAIAGMLLPSATITIQPKINQKSLILPVRAIIGEDQIRISGQIPVRKLVITVEDLQTVPASGTTSIPSEYASGEVVFTNLGEEALTIPVNTILSTEAPDPIQFLTKSPGRLNPGVGESITVQITALHPGSSGNVAAEQITTISSSLEAELRVHNPLPTSGGEEIFISAPNSTDRRRLDRNLTISLKDKAEEAIYDLLGQDDILLNPTLNDFEIIEEATRPEEGSPGDQLQGEKTVRYIILYSAKDDLDILAADLVNSQYQEIGFEPILESIKTSQLSTPVADQAQIFTWNIKVSWEEKQIIDQNEILQTILGKKPSEALTLLQEKLDLGNPPKIELLPSWWFRVPSLPFRINLTEGEK